MTKKLGQIMESFVARSRESTVPTNLGPVRLVKEEPKGPVIPMNRWFFEEKKRLRKRLVFSSLETRNEFLTHLFNYEAVKQHHGEISVTGTTVEICVWTPNLDTVTDLDKEYCKHVDILYRDVNYTPVYEL